MVQGLNLAPGSSPGPCGRVSPVRPCRGRRGEAGPGPVPPHRALPHKMAPAARPPSLLPAPRPHRGQGTEQPEQSQPWRKPAQLGST